MNEQVRYFESHDGTRIAYSVTGKGAPVVLLPSWLTHLDFQRRSVAWQPILATLAGRCRLIRYDPRGCGMSDREVRDLSFDAWVRDLGALITHLKLDRFALIGVCQGGAIAIEYTARSPGRVSHLVLFGTYARGRDRRGGTVDPVKAKLMLDMIRVGWGDEDHAFATAFAQQFQPEGSYEHLRSWCELQSRAASPETAVRLTKIMFDIDIANALPVIGCPTLVVHANRDAVVPVEEGRLLAKRIPGAKYVELDSPNHFLRPDEGGWERFASALHEFLPALPDDDGRWQNLSAREREIVEGVAAGLDNLAIARRLGISEKTVRNNVSAIFAKIGLAGRPQLIVAARQAGFGKDAD